MAASMSSLAVNHKVTANFHDLNVAAKTAYVRLHMIFLQDHSYLYITETCLTFRWDAREWWFAADTPRLDILLVGLVSS